MRLTWPAYSVGLTSHTVNTGRGLTGGFLLRCTASHRELGYIWPAGSGWMWRTPDAANFGERSSQEAAIRNLREIADLGQGRRTAPARPSAPRVEPRVTAPAPTPAPAAPVRKIVWADVNAADLTAQIGAALKRHQR